MTEKMPTKKMVFELNDEVFVKQLAHDIGCHFSKANPHTYSLTRSLSAIQGEMGAFAWVHKESENYFWVATRKIWIEKARSAANTNRRRSRASCLPMNTHRADDSVSFDTRANYDKTVSSLKLIHKMP
jgi:hypothetical protein